VSELEFLKGEAHVASSSAPEGLAVEVRDGGREGRYDVLFGGRAVARLLGKDETLACIMGVGGALAVLGASAPKESITIVDRLQPKWKKRFKSRRTCRAWLMEGLAGTEGAEQEHFSSMLVELECGATVLHYN